MNITPTERIRHGGVEYQPGQEYDVDDALGSYLVSAGWAVSDELTVAAPMPPRTVDLAIDDVIHNQHTEH